MEQRESRYNIRAVERALRVLSMLSDGRPRTLTDLSEAIEINNSTTYRLLSTLSFNNYVERDNKTNTYKLGIACLEMAGAYQESSDIRRLALPELEKLRDETKETVHLAVLDKMEVVYLEKLHGLHAIGIMSSQVGGRSPAYCTGLGKILLAYTDPEYVRTYYESAGLHRYSDSTIQNIDTLMDELALTRNRCYAFDSGEHEAEVHCIAAPIFSMKNTVIAAISVSGPASRMKPVEAQTELINKTKEAARVISARLGYRNDQKITVKEGLTS